MRPLLPLLILISLGAQSAAPTAFAATAGKPDVRSRSALVIDRADGSILYSQMADEVAPIASITKLMTALVVLDARQPLEERLEVTQADRIHGRGAASRIQVGAILTRGELLRLALMSSENRAAHVLGRNYPGGEAAAVLAMNRKAKALGMTRSRFVDPAGLSSGNVASAGDLVRLVIAASASPVIRSYSTTGSYSVVLGRHSVEFHNTNSLVRDPKWVIDVQKTGYLSDAGQCLVLQARITGRNTVIVLLNSFGKYTRVADARRIRQWLESRPPAAVAVAAAYPAPH
ncbi:MAG TPA: D-alanyl-D-alanine endopeptidase [Steroidobacteraceae bacterium]|nr:D-alanyl-D-alanine endopeptidase [Steroidobacteraceae bacterium]